jgi:hypothetical protein
MIPIITNVTANHWTSIIWHFTCRAYPDLLSSWILKYERRPSISASWKINKGKTKLMQLYLTRIFFFSDTKMNSEIIISEMKNNWFQQICIRTSCNYVKWGRLLILIYIHDKNKGTGFVTRLTWREALVKQELLTLPEYLSSPPVFSEVRVTRSLVLCVCFVDHCLSFCLFSFGHCVVFSSSICGF